MLGFMTHMLKNKGTNVAILVGSAAVFAVALWLVRSQATVDDVSYMKAMIPHHSIAIMTSKRAQIKDPRVRKLADGIIEAQVREIGESLVGPVAVKGRVADAGQHRRIDVGPRGVRCRDRQGQAGEQREHRDAWADHRHSRERSKSLFITASTRTRSDEPRRSTTRTIAAGIPAR